MSLPGAADELVRNLRLAGRSLTKTPGFAAAVVLTLALGIGANSAVFSAIDAVLLRPLPFPESYRLVRLGQIHPKNPQPQVAPIRIEEWGRMNHTLTGISGYYTQDSSEVSGELPERIKEALVAPGFFRTLGVAPALGRDFAPEEEHAGRPETVIISDRLWRRRFGADPKVIGKSLRFRGGSTPIIGVMPASFLFEDRDVDVWAVSPLDAPYARNREATWFTAIGRIKPGFTITQARADLAAVQAGLGRQFPKTDNQMRVDVQPLKEATVGGVRRSLWIVFGSVSLLLLIACANIAALLLSRAAGREHEIAVRFSLGASRASVTGQLLTEVLVLAVAGAAIGLGLAALAARVFATLAKDLPRVDEIALDWKIVAYSLACAVAATLACGLVPSLLGTRRSLACSLASAGRSQVSGRRPLQLTLVGVQVALAVTLLSGAGLLLRSFQELGRVAAGFDPDRVLTLQVSSGWGETADYKGSKQRAARIVETIRAVPGVESAAATTFSLPGVPAAFAVEFLTPEGRAESEPKMLAEGRSVSPDYFATMRIPLLSGEMCRDEPNVATAMVNRSFAETYLHGSSAIGRRLITAGNLNAPPVVIRGIVPDVRERGLDQAPSPTVYWCNVAMQPGIHFLARTHGDPMALAESVRRKLREIEPLRSVYGLSPLTAHLSDAFAENRLRTVLLTFFALTAIALACVGLYGTLSYLVNIRKREVGLRLALGALRGQIVRQFLRQGIIVAAAGSVAGIVMASAFTRLLVGMLFGVSAWDGVTLSAVIGLVLAVSLVASLLPAVRAARVEPMRVLRDE